MNNILICLIGSLTVVPALAISTSAPAHVVTTKVAAATTPIHGAILSGAEAKALFNQCSRASPQHDGWWKVSPRDVQNLEASLPRFWNAQKPKPSKPLTDYYRQYAGFTRKGRKMIYLNAFEASTADKKWKTRAVVVCDGGDLFFGVEYDVQSRTFHALSFNGR